MFGQDGIFFLFVIVTLVYKKWKIVHAVAMVTNVLNKMKITV